MSIHDKILKAGVVGLGHIGKRHASMMKVHPDFELVATCDIKSRTELQFEDDCPHYQSIDDLLEKENLDVISICTPNFLHGPQSILALDKGAHVICEKPLSLHIDDAQKMKLAASASGKKLFCVLQNRYSPTIQWLKKVVEGKALGDIHWILVQCFWNRDDRYYYNQDENGRKQPHDWHGSLEKDGGPLFTQFSHFIDILIHLFGEMDVMGGEFFNFNHQESTEFEDSGRISIRLTSGVPVELSYSTSLWDRNEESSINIIGSKGTIKIGGQYMNSLEYCHVEGLAAPELPEAGQPNEYGGYLGSANNHFHVFENVADVLLRNDESDLPLDEAIHGVQLIEKIYRFRKG